MQGSFLFQQGRYLFFLWHLMSSKQVNVEVEGDVAREEQERENSVSCSVPWLQLEHNSSIHKGIHRVAAATITLSVAGGLAVCGTREGRLRLFCHDRRCEWGLEQISGGWT